PDLECWGLEHGAEALDLRMARVWVGLEG
ncbi:MAG: hypothetical protein RLZZ142_691, partial [Verrucomicrobiota bacterium]